jgi:hypothetical protein
VFLIRIDRPAAFASAALVVTLAACRAGTVGQSGLSEAGPGPLGAPDGVTCSGHVCAVGMACCLSGGTFSCIPMDAATAATCDGGYLQCDGPQDCPGQWCCLEPTGLENVTRAICDGSGWMCPLAEEAPVCENNRECSVFGADMTCDGSADAGIAAFVRTCGF